MPQASEDWLSHKQFLLGKSPSRAELFLWELLGLSIDSRTEFGFFVERVSEGYGYRDDTGGISLPVDILDEAHEEGRIDTDFSVEVFFVEHGNGPDRTDRMSMSSFLFYSSIAIVLHARHVDSSLEHFSVINRMHVNCSPSQQFARVSQAARDFTGLAIDYW